MKKITTKINKKYAVSIKTNHRIPTKLSRNEREAPFNTYTFSKQKEVASATIIQNFLITSNS
jgi:phage regulator Rha-like protein